MKTTTLLAAALLLSSAAFAQSNEKKTNQSAIRVGANSKSEASVKTDHAEYNSKSEANSKASVSKERKADDQQRVASSSVLDAKNESSLDIRKNEKAKEKLTEKKEKAAEQKEAAKTKKDALIDEQENIEASVKKEVAAKTADILDLKSDVQATGNASVNTVATKTNELKANSTTIINKVKDTGVKVDAGVIAAPKVKIARPDIAGSVVTDTRLHIK